MVEHSSNDRRAFDKPTIVRSILGRVESIRLTISLETEIWMTSGMN